MGGWEYTIRALEDCCFSWAKSHRPLLLVENGWDCSEALELTAWTKVFKTVPEVGMRCSSQFKRSYNSIASIIDEIRHTAVHRRPVTQYRLDHFITAARHLAEVLEDVKCASRVADLRLELRSKIIAMDQKIDVLNDDFDKNLDGIHQRVAELNQEKWKLVRQAGFEYKLHRSLIGGLLENYVRSGFEHNHRQAPNDSTSHPMSTAVKVGTDATSSTELADGDMTEGEVVDESAGFDLYSQGYGVLRLSCALDGGPARSLFRSKSISKCDLSVQCLAILPETLCTVVGTTSWPVH